MKQAHRIHTAACSFALLSLALMIWWLLDPRRVPLAVAMPIGQLLLFALSVVLLADWRAQRSQRSHAVGEPALALKSKVVKP
jgi:uncharacterized membrane protein YqjE